MAMTNSNENSSRQTFRKSFIDSITMRTRPTIIPTEHIEVETQISQQKSPKHSVQTLAILVAWFIIGFHCVDHYGHSLYQSGSRHLLSDTVLGICNTDWDEHVSVEQNPMCDLNEDKDFCLREEGPVCPIPFKGEVRDQFNGLNLTESYSDTYLPDVHSYRPYQVGYTVIILRPKGELFSRETVKGYSNYR